MCVCVCYNTPLYHVSGKNIMKQIQPIVSCTCACVAVQLTENK